MTRWSLRGYLQKHSTAKCWIWQKTKPRFYFVKRIVKQRDEQREMEANRCCRKGPEVMKINIPLVWTSLCCSLCGTLVHFLRVSSANVSLFLYFSSCFILMPQWDCDNLHYVWGAAISHSCSLLSNRLQSAPRFDLLLPVVLGIVAFHYSVCAATIWNSGSTGAWERWPQGLSVGSKIVWSQGMR